MDADLALALSLADDADQVSRARFRAADLRVESKPDLTPVTDADHEVERLLRTRLAEERRGDGFLGEEAGKTGRGRRRVWVVDPIDGTRNYARGIPVWATLVALLEDGTVRLGVVSAPALGRRWWAERGEGAWADGEPIHVSGVHRLEDAVVTMTHSRRGGWLPQVADRAWQARGFGDFWGHMLVAEGAADACVDPSVSVWDLAAVQVVVEEAGGRFTDFTGTARPDGGNGLSSNGHLHDELLAAVGSD